MTRKYFNEKTDEIFDEIEAFIRAKMQHDFDHSNSTTPGLWERIEAEHQPLFDRINEYRRGVIARVNAAENHGITMAKNYALIGLNEANADQGTKRTMLNSINRLSATIREMQDGVKKGTYKPNVYEVKS